MPAIRNKVLHSGKYYAAKDYKKSQKFSPVPIKFTLPGPLTVMDTSADFFYNDRQKLNFELADTINKEILSLVKEGCRYIQIDEPLFARKVNDALSFGIEGLERCFHGVPSNITKIVHMCCGYPDYVDDVDYKKADPNSYFLLANHIDKMSIDQISIEDAHCCNDLSLLEKFHNKTVILGLIAIAKSRIETVEEVKNRISSALRHIDENRLIIAPDCGLGLLSAEIAEEKLKVMCKAASNYCL